MPPSPPMPASREGSSSSIFPPWMESARASRPEAPAGAEPPPTNPKATAARQKTPSRKRGRSRRRGAADRDLAEKSSCVEPDHQALLQSISAVLTRRIEDNDEHSQGQITHPLFCEDTHTEEPAEDEFNVIFPEMHFQALSFPTLYTLKKLRPPPRPPPSYPVPAMSTVKEFIENIWHRARLTPQSLVICLVYIDRLEARSEGAILHARSWRPIIFSSLLLASKVWHDVSYWNSDFSTICPMFTTRNINQMERAYLQLLQYNTIISASQYASYYFSLRTAALQTPSTLTSGSGSTKRPPGTDNNFRRKYFMTLNVPSASTIERKTMAVAGAIDELGTERSTSGAAILAKKSAARTRGEGNTDTAVTTEGGPGPSKQLAITRSSSTMAMPDFGTLPSIGDSPAEKVVMSYGARDKPTAPRTQPNTLVEYLSMSLCIM